MSGLGFFNYISYLVRCSSSPFWPFPGLPSGTLILVMGNYFSNIVTTNSSIVIYGKELPRIAMKPHFRNHFGQDDERKKVGNYFERGCCKF